MKRRKRPTCYGCNDKPARRLRSLGGYGDIALFCSLRCAAIRAVEKGMCDRHGWHEEKDCWECVMEARNGEAQ